MGAGVKSAAYRHWIAAALLQFVFVGAALGACPPATHARAALDALKRSGFAIEDDAVRNRLALALVDCLQDPDPALRDGLAFEAYSTWMRAGSLGTATRRALSRKLQQLLDPGSGDAEGFRQPFAALVLSEIARTDRIQPWMTPAERAALVARGSLYLSSIRDYRGFDPVSGWRHGVAHGADLLMQLALNPALTRAELDSMLAAVAAQVVPAQGVFYRYGESERLMRPVLFIAARGLHSEAEWSAWLQDVASPAPFAAWGDVFTSNAGLAKKHNTTAFLQSLYVNVAAGEDAALRERLLPALQVALRKLP